MTKKQSYLDFGVGLLMIASLLALFVLAFRVCGMDHFGSSTGYHVTADFSDIGGLRVRAPVTIAGVKVGEVTRIELQSDDLNAKVTMLLRSDKKIPSLDSSARILTEGLIGSNYISIVPGFEDSHDAGHAYLREGDVIEKTQSAVILENLIGQLLFNINKQ